MSGFPMPTAREFVVQVIMQKGGDPKIIQRFAAQPPATSNSDNAFASTTY